METIKLGGINRPVMTRKQVGIATVRALARALQMPSPNEATRRVLDAYLARKGVERYAATRDGASGQWVYFALGAPNQNRTRAVLAQTTIYGLLADPLTVVSEDVAAC